MELYQYHTSHKIVGLKELVALTYTWRLKDKKIVFTNGCFDILHPGHIEYLEQAKALGNILIIGLNSDSSVEKLKGSPRPYLSEEGRSRLLAALEFVDAVVIFEEDTPAELIKAIRPDVLVKGADYKPEEIAGADSVRENGGEVVTIPLKEGFSTSKLVEKIRS